MNQTSTKVNDDIHFLGNTTLYDLQISLVGNRKKILVLETDDYISKKLEENNYNVTKIILDEEKLSSKNILSMDIQNLDFESILKNTKFDVVIIDDFLSRVDSPDILLKKIHSILLDDGYVICVIPNISHGSVRLELLNGQFKYNETSIIQKYHKKFFTLDSILSLIHTMHFSINKLHRVTLDVIPTTSELHYYSFPQDLINSILFDNESKTSHFVFVLSYNEMVDNTIWSFANSFSRNLVSEKLDSFIQKYLQELAEKEYLVKFLKNAISSKDEIIQGLENSVKEQKKYLEHVIIEKSQLLDKVVIDYKTQINEIKNSKIWKIAKFLDKIRKSNH